MNVDLAGRIALVTGGSSGMGAEIARELARSGADVAIVGRDEGRLAEVLAEIEASGRACHSLRADLTAPGAAADVVSRVIGRFGRLDILVNAAGIFRPALIDDATETFAAELAINVQAPYSLTQAALRTSGRSAGPCCSSAPCRAARPSPRRAGTASRRAPSR